MGAHPEGQEVSKYSNMAKDSGTKKNI